MAVFLFDLAVHPSGKQGIIALSRCFHKFPVNLGQDTTADKTTFGAADEIFVSRVAARALQHARKPLLSGFA
jgi:hypothetical protein